MEKKKLVVLSGAGISAESGVKTFRDMDGLWENHKVEDVATITAWRHGDKQLILDFYNARRKQLDEVEPNSAHKFFAELEEYFDVHIVTQNVDDLHERGGSTKIVHLHGELRKTCNGSKNRVFDYTEDIKLGDKAPDGSQIRPYIVWFGEDVPEIYHAANLMSQADIVVVIGTTLEVYPAAGIIDRVKHNVPIFVIDPNKPAITSKKKNVTFIEKVATEGVLELKELLKEIHG